MRVVQLFFAAVLVCHGAVITVSTAQYNNARSGENTSETGITPANISSLVKVGQYVLDGALYGQPLYIPGLIVNGGTYNVVIMATMNNTVYALDADAPGAAPLWSTNFGVAWSSYNDNGGEYHQAIGILSTPVVDVSASRVYVVTCNNTPTYTLRKLNLLTGVQVASIAISGSVSGTGADSSAGSVPFVPAEQTQRSALTLANGNVYVGFGSLREDINWHGWVFSYDAATLTQQAILNLTPNGLGGGLWGSAGGIAVDGSGNLYFATGNGDWDGTANFSQSIVKTNGSLVIQDWFTPSNESSTSGVDADVASARVMLIPSTSLLTFASKDGRAWVLSTSSMGHLQGTGTAPQVFTIQSITAGQNTGVYGGVFFNGVGYFPITGNPLYAFSFSGSTFTTTPLAVTSPSFAQMAMSASSDSGSDGILWCATVNASPFLTKRPVILRALDPSTLTELWNSGTIGNYAKFASPTIANGRVYVPSNDGNLVVFAVVLNPPAPPLSVTGVLTAAH